MSNPGVICHLTVPNMDMDEESMRGRALRLLTSDSLHDFITLLVVNPENQEAMLDSMKQRPTNLRNSWLAGAATSKKYNQPTSVHL
jgi:hypothetical protein